MRKVLLATTALVAMMFQLRKLLTFQFMAVWIGHTIHTAMAHLSTLQTVT